MPFTVAIVELPLRFQAVNGLTSFDAGIRLLPFAFFSPFGAAISSVAASKFKVSPILLLLFGATFQTIDIVLLSTLSTSKHIQPAQYGFEVLAAIGIGSNIVVLLLMTPAVLEDRDRGRPISISCGGKKLIVRIAIGTGAITQFRVMGGTIGLAIVASVLDGWLRSRLPLVLSPQQIDNVLRSAGAIRRFEPAVQDAVRVIFAQGFNLQFRILIGFTVAQFPVTLLIWQKKGFDLP